MMEEKGREVGKMEVSNDIIHNFICDLRKMDIDPIERAKIVKAYMMENHLSLRKFSRDFGVPKTTANNWLHYLKIGRADYKKLQDKGYSKARIREIVFKNEVQEKLDSEKDSDLDHVLEETITKFEHYLVDDIDVSSNTAMLLYRLSEILRTINKKVAR